MVGSQVLRTIRSSFGLFAARGCRVVSGCPTRHVPGATDARMDEVLTGNAALELVAKQLYDPWWGHVHPIGSMGTIGQLLRKDLKAMV